jgi:ABC-type transporter Mla subunit MlaD
MRDTFTSAPVTAQLQSLDGRTQVQTTAIESVGQQIADLSRNQRGLFQVLEQHQAMFGRIDAVLERLASLSEAAVKGHDDTARMLADVRAQLGELRSLPADLAAARLIDPDIDNNEVPRYASANPVSLAINPLQTGNVPSFGHAPSSALQPFVQMTASILVR